MPVSIPGCWRVVSGVLGLSLHRLGIGERDHTAADEMPGCRLSIRELGVQSRAGILTPAR
jgi:hypothetical protein